MTIKETPKVFISYSWSSSEHMEFVLKIATELRESGVEAILDKWRLRIGDESTKFMESMVTDPTISKVIMICDKAYQERADNREGGVGIESQIITSKIYEQEDENKFAAIITENDENGKPYVPAFYTSRIYIDFVDAEYSEKFEELLRWIYGKPQYKEPELGTPPAYILDEDRIDLGTTALYRRCLDAIKKGNSNVLGVFREYCDLFVSNLERYRIKDKDSDLVDKVLHSLEMMIPNRNEYIELVNCIAMYNQSSVFIDAIHSFFEDITRYMSNGNSHLYPGSHVATNFDIIAYEMFVYTIAVMIRYHEYATVGAMLSEQFYIQAPVQYRNSALKTFTFYCRILPPMDYNEKIKENNKFPPYTQFLQKRCRALPVDFNSFIIADFILYCRCVVDLLTNITSNIWDPHSLYALKGRVEVLELFERATSKKYFDKIKIMLGIGTRDDLESIVDKHRSLRMTGNRHYNWDYFFNQLVNLERIATKE